MKESKISLFFPGDRFPESDSKTTHGLTSIPSALKDHLFIFFSYPTDFTPVYTAGFVVKYKTS